MDGSATVSVETLSCRSCGIARKLMKRCIRCRSVLYCSRQCQIGDWKNHQQLCFKISLQKKSDLVQPDESLPSPTKTSITVKSNHKKHKIILNNVESSGGDILLKKISEEIRVPLSSLKLVGKGSVITQKNVREMLEVQNCKMFQAFGEEAENEDDLDKGDIEAMMNELHVSRNLAIRSLRTCNGDLIDAILELGNKI